MTEDFFSYGNSLTPEEMCNALDEMEGLWGRNLYDSRWHMLVMSSEDDEVNIMTLRLLPIFMRQRGITGGVILVSSDCRMEDMAARYVALPYRFAYCDRDTIVALGRVMSVFTYSKVLSFNSLDLTTDNDACRLVQKGLLSKQEVLALACLQLDHVPCEEELNEACKGTISGVSRGDGIDWHMYPPAPYLGDKTDIFSGIIGSLQTETDRPVLIFGAIRSTATLHKRLSGHRVMGIIDNDSSKQGSEYDGLPVYSPEELPERFGHDIRIVVHTRHFREICEQLMGLGYEMGVQILPAYVADDLYFRKDELKDQLRDVYYKGKETYADIRKRHPDKPLVHLPYSGTGDAYLAGIYMEDISKTHNFPAPLFIVRSNACRKILELFGYEGEVLGEGKSDALTKYARITGFKHANYVMFNDSYDFRTSIRLRGINGVDFHTMFRESVFKVSKMRTIPKMKQDNADDLIDAHGLERGNTVLISPYATTADGLSDETWEWIADKLKDMGFRVCTNVASDNEMPVTGTEGVQIPYIKLLDFVNKCGFFIGLRSGLCDIISSTSARKIIIYPGFIGNEMHTPHFALTYFGLGNMGLCGDETYEVEFDRGGDDRLVESVMRHVKGKWR